MSGEFFYSTAADLVRRKPVSRNSIKEFVDNCLQISEERNKLRVQKQDLRAELEARDSEIAMLKRMLLESENKNAECERQIAERGQQILAWQSIETAPKDGTRVLMWWEGASGYDNLGWHMTYWLDNSKTENPWSGWRIQSNVATHAGAKPTYWMPLPAAPQIEVKP